MKRRPPPPEIHRPVLLRLALWLAPERQRMWLEDMAAEHAFVPAAGRPGWALGALGLALRWRVLSWGQVPRAQLAVTVMALALLAASPWLLREYALNTLGPVVETESVDSLGRLEADRALPSEPSEEAATGLAQQAPAPAAPAAAEASADQDAFDQPPANAAARAVTAPESDDEGLRDQAEAQDVGADVVGEVSPPAPTIAEPAASELDQEASGRFREDERREADLDEAQILADRQVVAVEEASLTLRLLRPTKLVLIAGSDETGEPYLDREAEAGERIVVLPPVVVVAEDGGAIEVSDRGLLGDDGRSTIRVFTTEATP